MPMSRTWNCRTFPRARRTLPISTVPPTRWPKDKGGAAGMEKAFTQWLSEQRAHAVEWHTLRPVEMKTNLPLLTLREDGNILGSGDITKSDRYDLAFRSELKNITAIRL